MTRVTPFEERRFRTAARHYLRGRPFYAAGLIRRLVQISGLGPGARVMDLGCGPGQLAVALAPFVGEVVALDPEPEMLRIAAQSAAAAHLDIRFLKAGSEDIGPRLGESDLGRFDLVVIGRAFHWMDRPRTLQRLGRLIAAGGAVALLDTKLPKLPDNAWAESYEALIERYSAGDETRRRRKSADWLPHEAVLLDSAFSRIEAIEVLERRRTPLAQFIDRALSLSSTSAARIGHRTAELAVAIDAALAPFATEGLITEAVASRATLAWRPEG